MKADPGICSGCKRPILWVTNENGKHEPFDARPVRVIIQEDRTVPEWRFQAGAFISHFITCPQAARFKKPDAAKGGGGPE